jgi:toxin ParE1/3/4
MGRTRDDLSPGLRSYPVGDHIVFYRVTATELIVRRIVHGRRELERNQLS